MFVLNSFAYAYASVVAVLTYLCDCLCLCLCLCASGNQPLENYVNEIISKNNDFNFRFT